MKEYVKRFCKYLFIYTLVIISTMNILTYKVFANSDAYEEGFIEEEIDNKAIVDLLKDLGTIKIYKLDADFKGIANSQFQLSTDVDFNNIVEEEVTAENGEAVFPSLYSGVYYIREKTINDRYVSSKVLKINLDRGQVMECTKDYEIFWTSTHNVVEDSVTEKIKNVAININVVAIIVLILVIYCKNRNNIKYS